MFRLYNKTDQVYASPDDFVTEAEAAAYATAFRRRFARQGYYLTAECCRIDPADVELVIEPVAGP